jgi:hypothetical protein
MARLRALLQREDTRADPLPPQLPDPAPRGLHTVQLLRTYPKRRRGYVFAPDGERSIARSYLKVLRRARSLIYIEDQYLWSTQVARPFAEALAANPGLHLIAVIPRFPDQDGRLAQPPNMVGHQLALQTLHRSGGDRVAVYGIENHEHTPVYDTPRHASSTTCGHRWALTTSTGARGPMTPNSAAPSSTRSSTSATRSPRGRTVTALASLPGSCG